MPRAALVVPGRLERSSGGNRYDRVVLEALRERGWTVDVRDPGDDVGEVALVILDSLAFPAGPVSTDAPVVALAHQVPGEVLGGGASPAEVSALRSAAVVVTVAGWLAERLRKLTPVPTEVIPPGRDGAWASDGPDRDADTILCVGNAVPGKGLPEAVEAFLAAALDDATLVMVGDLGWDSNEADRLRREARGAPDRVRVEGAVPAEELAERYRRARFLVSASRYEGWPIAVAEAMASGLPVVGFDVPGMRELVRPGVDGVLVAAGDTGSLGAAIAEVWSDPEAGRRMGASGRRRALAWPTWEETGRRFAALVDRVTE